MSSIASNLHVIAAICGNFYQESTVNPGIWENLTVGAPGFGLGQWTDNPPQVMRRTALFNWLDANGYSRDSGPGQLRFLVYENSWLTTGPGGVVSRFTSLTDFLGSQSTDLQMLTEEFYHHWEGIEDGTLQIRYNFALDAVDAFSNDDGTRWPWYSSNSYNSVIYAKRNSLLIKDYFLGDSPEEPTEEELLAILAYIRRKKGKIGGIYIEF